MTENSTPAVGNSPGNSVEHDKKSGSLVVKFENLPHQVHDEAVSFAHEFHAKVESLVHHHKAEQAPAVEPGK